MPEWLVNELGTPSVVLSVVLQPIKVARVTAKRSGFRLILEFNVQRPLFKAKLINRRLACEDYLALAVRLLKTKSLVFSRREVFAVHAKVTA